MAGHHHVHEDDVRAESARIASRGLAAAAGVADDVIVLGLALEEHVERLAQHGVVIDDRHL